LPFHIVLTSIHASVGEHTAGSFRRRSRSFVPRFAQHLGGESEYGESEIWRIRITAASPKLRASDGFNLGTFADGSTPYGVAFDGANIWVVNFSSNTVSKR